jgi:HAD superfamily hydrolase (TIGR01549 family)
MVSMDAVFFDLDETLLDDATSYDIAISRVAADMAAAYPRFGFSDLFAVYKRVADEYWPAVAEAVIRGRLRGDDVRLEAWRRALSTYGVIDEHIAQAALQSYSVHRSNTYAVFPDVLGVVTSLREQFKLAIITNGASYTQWDKVRATRLEACFDLVLVSGDIGVGKPDAAIFRAALNKLELDPERVWHVGDSLEADVAGACQTGLGAAVWMNRNGAKRPDGSPKPHHEISTLLELPPLLGFAEQ